MIGCAVWVLVVSDMSWGGVVSNTLGLHETSEDVRLISRHLVFKYYIWTVTVICRWLTGNNEGVATSKRQELMSRVWEPATSGWVRQLNLSYCVTIINGYICVKWCQKNELRSNCEVVILWFCHTYGTSSTMNFIKK